MRLISAAEERVMGAVVEQLRADIAHLRQQNAELLATILSLKTQGATLAPLAPLPKRNADGLAQVITSVAGHNSALRQQLGVFVRDQKALGADDNEILERLRNWDDVSDDGVSE